MLISDAFEQYRNDYIVFRNQSSRTEEMHLCALKCLINHVGDVSIEDLTFDMVRSWAKDMSKSRSANTVRGYIIKLRVVLKHIRARGVAALDPDLVGVPKREARPVEFISAKEVAKLIDAVAQPHAGYPTVNRLRNKAIIALLYASGIRVSELCGLDRLALRDDMTFTVVGKGGKARLCFYDRRAGAAIRAYLSKRHDDTRPLFTCEKTGKRITKDVVELVFRNATTKAGFEKRVHPHTLRHSFATNMLQNNANIVYVRDFLGHSSVQTTEMYMHVVNKDLQKQYDAYHTY